MVKQQEWVEIYNLFTSGLSVPQISKKVDRSTTTIYNLLKNGGPNSRKLLIDIKNQGYLGSYNLVNNYVRLITKGKYSNYKPSIRFETSPGQQAQVDWGHFGKIEINERLEKLF